MSKDHHNQINDECNIERCTANSEFALIPNEISQHPTMSSDATTILIYLLSCKSDWVVKPKNVWNAKNISRKHVYKAFDELIELGYMNKEEIWIGNLKSTVKYKVSYLKKYLRRTEIGDTEPRYTENRYGLIKNIVKKNDLEKDNNKTKEVVVFPIFSDLEIPEAMKVKLSSQMDKEKAFKLVQRIKAWKGRGSDAIACNTILGQWDTWEDTQSKEDKSESNKAWVNEHLKQFDEKVVSGYKCTILNKFIEFCSGGVSSPKCFMYDHADFMSLIKVFLDKSGIKI